MLLILQDHLGRTVEAVLLSAFRNTMRVAFRNSRDAVELIYSSGRWMTEEGRLFDISAMVVDDVFKLESVSLWAKTARA